MTNKTNDLISLDELAAVLDAYAGPPDPQVRRAPLRVRRLRPAVVAAVVAAALGLTGVAIAAGVGVFDGISAANHPQASTDKLDAAMADLVANANVALAAIPNDPDGQVVASGSRLIGQLASGANVYVLATTTNKLCVLTQQTPSSENFSGINCLDPLGQSQPTTLVSKPPLTYGVAQDGVASVSFGSPSGQVTVPVKNNVWSYEGDADLSSVTVNYDDGSTQTITGPSGP